jgi:hypothetical protein
MKPFISEIQEVNWSTVRSLVQKAEPELADVIDDLSPDNTFTLLRVSYPFGSLILDKATLHLPASENKSFPLSHSEVPLKIKEALNYSNLPLGCIVNNHGIEVFRELKDKLHSIAFYSSGLDLGIWEFFSPPTPFSISAGARSLMMLPKISDSVAHNTLKRYNVHPHPPLSSYDQWYTFKDITASKCFSKPWHCDVVYFTSRWAEKIRNDPAWFKFKYFLLNRAWGQTEHNRNRFLYDEMWESFFNILSSRKIKPISYVVDLFTHLIYLAQGSRTVIAYRPANGEETAGPINELLRVYLEEYKLKTYAPTLMLPSRFTDDLEKPIYYSLQLPTYWDSAPKSRDSVSVRKDLNYLIWLMDAFERELTKGNIHITIPSINQLFDKVRFEFFHSDGNIDDRVKPSSTMPQEDKNLLYLPGDKDKYGERKFADRSSFARACVRVSLK